MPSLYKEISKESWDALAGIWKPSKLHPWNQPLHCLHAQRMGNIGPYLKEQRVQWVRVTFSAHHPRQPSEYLWGSILVKYELIQYVPFAALMISSNLFCCQFLPLFGKSWDNRHGWLRDDKECHDSNNKNPKKSETWKGYAKQESMQSGGNNSPKNGVAFDNQTKFKRSNRETSNSNGSVDFCHMCWTAICPKIWHPVSHDLALSELPSAIWWAVSHHRHWWTAWRLGMATLSIGLITNMQSEIMMLW